MTKQLISVQYYVIIITFRILLGEHLNSIQLKHKINQTLLFFRLIQMYPQDEQNHIDMQNYLAESTR